MHATVIDSIKELPPEIDFSSSGGIVQLRHKVAWGMANELPAAISVGIIDKVESAGAFGKHRQEKGPGA